MLNLAILGFGSRGQMFAQILEKIDDVKLIAIAEPVDASRNRGKDFGIREENLFENADDFFAKGKICDALFICTQDAQHHDMAIKALNLGYDICLEKPAAATIEDCIDIRDTANKLNKKVMLTHVLRYAPFYSYIKKKILEGQIGNVVNIRQTENIAYWHFALSYVRGPWRNMEKSTPTILAKCCHDLDIIKWLIGKKCIALNSFGNNFYFNEKNAPKNSAMYCADCCKETREKCVYNAYKIYPEKAKKAVVGGLAKFRGKDIYEILNKKQDIIAKCVFHSDNDAIDNQVVNMLFEGGTTAILNMNAFSDDCHRTIEIHGTLGEIFGDLDEAKLHINIFGKNKDIIDVNKVFNKESVDLSGGHGGGDTYLTLDFIDYITNNTPSITRTTINDSIESHIMGFKAEESRLNSGKTIKL